MSRSKNISVCALMLDPYDVSPGQRFRLEQWEPFLKKDNIELNYFSFTDDNFRKVIYQQGQTGNKIKELSKALLRRASQIFNAPKYDVVFVYRAAAMIGPAIFERYLSLRGVPIIYDFDDAIFLTQTSNENKRFGWAKFAGKTGEICRISKSITVGNAYLAEYARQFNENVSIIPSSIDINRYQPIIKTPNPEKRIVIGWTGSSTSQYYLEEFEPMLAELLKVRDVEIRVISNREPTFKTIPFVWREWSTETEVAETAEIDVGIMPLPDDEWTRGKCAMKALIYMSLAIPAVCSNVGVNKDVIKHGENGFLAQTTEEWVNSLKSLIDDAELRRKFGARARETVVEGYSMEKCAELFAKVVHDTVQTNGKNGGN